ncbi:MAG: type I 3-dehydroquinate dehydratase [Candidatus Bathyarchaeia archaeon]
MRPRICVSVMPRTVDEAATLQEKARRGGGDLVELRLDRMGRLTELGRFTRTGMPVIATNRSADEGGSFQGSEEERFQILLTAAQAGFDYVDIEDSTGGLKGKMEALRDFGAKIICSHHNMDSTPTPTELKRILNRNMRLNADIYKIITTARSPEDSLITLNFLSEASKQSRIVCFAMGEAGKISRVACPLYGSFFTVASLERGSETAPGQLTVEDLRTVYARIGLD